MLRDLELRDRYEDPEWVPYTAWRVLEAVAELIALDPEVREYRLHSHIAARGLAARVARQVGQGDMVAETERALALLARAELVVLTEDAVRLGRDYEPDLPRPAARVVGTSEAKAAAARENGKGGGRPPAQPDILLPLKGGLSAQPSNGGRKPTVGSDGFAAETQTEPTAEPTAGSGGFSAAPQRNPTGLRDAPGLLAAAAVKESEKILEQQQQAATAVLTSRAGSGTQAEPTVKPTAEPSGFLAKTQAEPTAPAKPAGPLVRAPEVCAEALALAEEASRQFGFTEQHREEAPGIMQGYLDEGYTAEQVRAVLRDKRGTRATSARMLGKALAARFPEVRYRSGGAGSDADAARGSGNAATAGQADGFAFHPVLKEIPGWESFSVEKRSAANFLLRRLDEEDMHAQRRAAKYVYDTNRGAFLCVAALRHEVWSLAGEEPPD